MSAKDQEIEDFLASRRDQLARFAGSLTSDAGQAEDLVQIALERCYPKWNSIAPGRHEAYLKVVMVRENISLWRVRKWRELLVDDVPDNQTVADHQANYALSDQVWRALRRLPVKQRTAIVLRFAFDWPISEVAQAMRVQQGTIKSLCARGIATLKADQDLRIHASFSQAIQIQDAIYE